MKDNKPSDTFLQLQSFIVKECNGKVASGGKEIIKKCHICGDSRDPSSAHMYIGMKDGVILYNCFKCNAKGIVDAKFLRDIGCYNTDLLVACNSQKTNPSTSRSVAINNNTIRYLKIPNSIDYKKVEYINNRLGLQISYDDIYKYRIITNFAEFMSFNNINKYTRSTEVMNILNDYYIGFLSMDMTHIIFRRIVEDGILPKFIDQRYINYNIYGNDNGKNFYSIKGTIQRDKQISMCLAEGVFDILSIESNFRLDNCIYAAVCGKSYSSLISYIIMKYGITGFDLHLYIDNDIDIKNLYSIKSIFKPFNINIQVHRNTFPGQKDFGVSVDMITDSVTTL